MRRWIIGGATVVVVVLIGFVGMLVVLRDTTRFDDRAYPGSSWGKTPNEVFTDFDITLPECTNGRMRYWAGSLELYLKISAPPACVSQFVEENRLSTSEPLPAAPLTVTSDKRAANEFDWELPAERVYTSHRREEDTVETQAWTDDAAERSLYLHAWRQ